MSGERGDVSSIFRGLETSNPPDTARHKVSSWVFQSLECSASLHKTYPKLVRISLTTHSSLSIAKAHRQKSVETLVDSAIVVRVLTLGKSNQRYMLAYRSLEQQITTCTQVDKEALLKCAWCFLNGILKKNRNRVQTDGRNNFIFINI